MHLYDAVVGVATNPGSTTRRVLLAILIQDYGEQYASLIWEAAAHVAAAKGDFFDALALCRLHLAPNRQKPFLQKLVEHYFGDPTPHEAIPRPPQPRSIQPPQDHSTLLKMALQIGADQTGIRLTHHVPTPDIPILGDLSKELLVLLLHKMQPIPLQPHETFIKEGDEEKACYLVTHGQIQVTRQQSDGSTIELATLNAPVLTGEIALLTALSRRASVSALTPALAWRISAELISRINEIHSSLFPQIRKLIRNRLIQNLIRSNQLFAELHPQERQALLKAFSMKVAHPNETILKLGEKSSHLFLILHGQALIKELNALGELEESQKLTEGSIVGAHPFFNHQPSLVSISMPEGGLLLQLSREKYEELRTQFPQLDTTLRTLDYIHH